MDLVRYERRVVLPDLPPVEPCWRTDRPKRKRGRRDNSREVAKYNRWKRIDDGIKEQSRRNVCQAFGVDPDAPPKNDTLTLAMLDDLARQAGLRPR